MWIRCNAQTRGKPPTLCPKARRPGPAHGLYVTFSIELSVTNLHSQTWRSIRSVMKEARFPPMKTQLSRASLLAAALVAAAGAAHAQGEFSGNVAIGTDYVWRGVSQSNGDMAISGGFDYSNGMFYAGTWASNIDFDDGSDANVEIDFYGGIASEFANGVSWDLGVIYYAYPDSEDSDLDFVELKGALGYAFDGGLAVGGEVYYDPDNQNMYLNATAGFALTENFGIDGSVGNYQFDAGGDYTNWSLGASTSAGGFGLDLRYWGTDVDGVEVADDRVVFTISRSL
jgi:uncharacterized protein (TIGR02001 family)